MSTQNSGVVLYNSREKLEYAHPIYFKSLNENNLLQARSVVEEVLKDNYATDKEKVLAKKLYVLIKCKVLAINYFDGGYHQEKYDELNNYVLEVMPKLEGSEFDRTRATLTRLNGLLNAVHGVMDGIYGEIERVRDDDGNLVTKSKDVLTDAANVFTEKANALRSYPDNDAVFGAQVNMFDIKNQAINDLNKMAEYCLNAINNFNVQNVNEFISKKGRSLSDLEGESIFTFSPAFPNQETTPAKTIILSSPLYDESVLYARAYAKEYGLDFLTFSASDFMGEGEYFINNFVNYLYENKKSVVFFGFDSYTGENKNVLIKQLVEISLKGVVCLAFDTVGDKSVYENFYSVVKQNSLPLTSVTSKFIALPKYETVITEFENRGMITAEDYEYVRKNFAYAGYVGFNKALIDYVAGKSWKDEMLVKSNLNSFKVLEYVKNLATQIQILDTEWIDLNSEKFEDESATSSSEFDYDAIKSSNPVNVKKILNSSHDIFTKCGLITRYCTLCGDDVSVWPELSVEEKSNRLTDATKLVAYILQTQYSPVVEVVAEEDWTVKGAGGLCCDGGKLIQYNERYIDDYDWILTVIAHEVFHAFQHTAVDCGWRSWYFTKLGVTKYRVPEWSYNFDHYNGSMSVNYSIQMVEGDARAFANDCYNKSKGVWSTIDLE